MSSAHAPSLPSGVVHDAKICSQVVGAGVGAADVVVATDALGAGCSDRTALLAAERQQSNHADTNTTHRFMAPV
jgi:hypothetical protein